MFDLLGRLYRGTDGLLGRMAHLMGSSTLKGEKLISVTNGGIVIRDTAALQLKLGRDV